MDEGPKMHILDCPGAFSSDNCKSSMDLSGEELIVQHTVHTCISSFASYSIAIDPHPLHLAGIWNSGLFLDGSSKKKKGTSVIETEQYDYFMLVYSFEMITLVTHCENVVASNILEKQQTSFNSNFLLQK